jgi:hypothetical protein
MPDDDRFDTSPRPSVGSPRRGGLGRRGWVVGAVALTALTLAAGVTGDHGHAPWQPSCTDGGRHAA